ncbi:polar growth protein [Ceratobasidium sp. 395]|nr:polar growth protein [Ceratobasidium sp. 395]
MARSQSSVTVPGLKPGKRVVDQAGEPDYSGWMRKTGDRYNSWKLRYFMLTGRHFCCLRSRTETKIKGYVNTTRYKIIADENAYPVDTAVVRGWMEALMKATIARNFNDPARSSCNIPAIPLAIAQQMNPAPRPPSPSEREAAQHAARRENPEPALEPRRTHPDGPTRERSGAARAERVASDELVLCRERPAAHVRCARIDGREWVWQSGCKLWV